MSSLNNPCSMLEAFRDAASARDEVLRRSLVQQAVSQKLLSGTREALQKGSLSNASAPPASIARS
jgi:hypothetical protein